MSEAPDGPFFRVEVITSVQRRRRCFMAGTVPPFEEAMQPGMSVPFVACQAGIAALQPASRRDGVREFKERVGDLKRLLRRKTMECEILKWFSVLKESTPSSALRRH